MAITDLSNILQRTGGISAIATQLGIAPGLAEAGANALLPAIIGGFSKQATGAEGGADGGTGGGAGGLGGLIGMLGGLGGTGLAANVLGPEPTDTAKGDQVLGQIFGSKDVSRTVATHAAGQTGIDPELLKKMLPILAMLVGGYLSHAGGVQQGNPSGGSGSGSGGGGIGGMIGSVLGSVLGGAAGGGSSGQAGGGVGGMLGSLLGMAGGSQGGNALDEIIGMAGKLAH